MAGERSVRKSGGEGGVGARDGHEGVGGER